MNYQLWKVTSEKIDIGLDQQFFNDENGLHAAELAAEIATAKVQVLKAQAIVDASVLMRNYILRKDISEREAAERQAKSSE
jgi:hypothetical protein